MSRRRGLAAVGLALLALLALLTVVGGLLLTPAGGTPPPPAPAQPPPPAQPLPPAQPPPPAHREHLLAPPYPDSFFDPLAFHAGLRRALAERAEAAGEPEPLLGGVVPHHLLPGYLLSDFFLDLAAAPPRTVILVGPNHENRGARVATSRRGWATPFGTVAVDQEWIDWLAAEGLAVVDDAALLGEHSVGGLMPYLAFHLPGTRVVPIILHHGVSVAEARQLALALAPRLGPDVVLVASVDFSHYLTRAQAEARDQETLAVLGRRDWPVLFAMGNDHLDSPASVGLAFMALAAAGAGEPVLAAHTNSGALVGDDEVETTSYLVFKFNQKP